VPGQSPAAEHPLPTDLRAAAAEEVTLKLFELEDGEKIVNGARHGSSCLTLFAAQGCD
jgi:hypothetical protein